MMPGKIANAMVVGRMRKTRGLDIELGYFSSFGDALCLRLLRMLRFTVTALRWVSDEPQPGLLEFSVTDANGHDHRILEKDILTPSPLTRDAPFPLKVRIEAETHEATDGNVTITLPWHMQTTTGETELTLSEDQLSS